MKKFIEYIVTKMGRLPEMNGIDVTRNLFLLVPPIAFFFIRTNYLLVDIIVKCLSALLALFVLIGYVWKWKYSQYLNRTSFLKKEVFRYIFFHILDCGVLPVGRNRIEVRVASYYASNFIPLNNELVASLSLLPDLMDSGYVLLANDTGNKMLRNLSRARKNPKTILLIKDSKGRVVGHSHLVPVNNFTKERFISGGMRTDDFHQDDVCDDEHFTAVIVLSVVYHPNTSQPYSPELLSRCLLYHLGIFLKGKKSVELVFQSPNRRFTQILETYAFRKEAGRSADGLELFVIEVVNMDQASEVMAMAIRA